MNDPSFSLQGKVIVQIGGTGLLGRALVTALAAAGATRVVAAPMGVARIGRRWRVLRRPRRAG